jgi:hypothetical protein
VGRPGKEEIVELVRSLSLQGSCITDAVIQVDGGMGMLTDLWTFIERSRTLLPEGEYL